MTLADCDAAFLRVCRSLFGERCGRGEVIVSSMMRMLGGVLRHPPSRRQTKRPPSYSPITNL
ncbi:hypothetical protein RSSM_03127 [Rhodopirellula sallentina SM41]|uniref:Uncharacterized protein n=1 Tax=Rhodopirellula sallentina SM41 TaxID=1263870 RepID=M5U1T0_9BACT|nr:hypothetical protein RSSM_03127 [Rhodopirellula sallentina SM41]